MPGTQSHVFARNARGDPLPRVVHGAGCYLIDSSGRRYLDGSCGAAVSCLGHSDEAVVQAIRDQLGKVAYAHTSFFTSEPAEALADKLVAHAPEGIDRVYLLSGGSEVVEAALKLARQYYLEIGQPERHHVIARRQSYHGNTLGALATGGNLWRRESFAPILIETSHISPCYEYRGRASGETAEAYGRRMADELESEICRLGPETVMAFVAEPVVGATLGAVPPVPGYFRRIRQICDHHGVLLILDEVMCGMGRTGTLFACEQEGITGDIITIAKGIGGGYQPLSAMLVNRHIHQAIAEGSGAFQHGHTYMGHPVAAAAGLAVLRRLVDDGIVAGVNARGAFLQTALETAFADRPAVSAHVGDIRGRGLFRGIELVQDCATKAPFDPALGLAARIRQVAMAEGLICYPMPGTIDGRRGEHVLLAPPFIILENEIEELAQKLARALGAVLADLPAS